MNQTSVFFLGVTTGTMLSWGLFQLLINRMASQYKEEYDKTFDKLDKRLRAMHVDHMEDLARLHHILGVKPDGPPPPMQ